MSVRNLSSSQEIYPPAPSGWNGAEPKIRRADPERVAGVWVGLGGDGAVRHPAVLPQQVPTKLHLCSGSQWQ